MMAVLFSTVGELLEPILYIQRISVKGRGRGKGRETKESVHIVRMGLEASVKDANRETCHGWVRLLRKAQPGMQTKHTSILPLVPFPSHTAVTVISLHEAINLSHIYTLSLETHFGSSSC